MIYHYDEPGEFVIEVEFDQPAWIADNQLQPQPPYGTLGYERDSLALDLARAHVFERYPDARNTIERLKVGYPQWRCNCQKLTDDYRARHAGLADPTLALPAPAVLRLTP
jgi:hypothetical protein